MNRSLRSSLLLVLTALIWGVAFVAQDVAMDSMPPFAFNALRMALAALALIPVCMWNDARVRRTGAPMPTGEGTSIRRMSPAQRRQLLTGGAICGALLAIASSFQQLGIAAGGGAGKAGFVTALYIVLVPLTGLFFRKRVHALVWLAVAVSTVGLYLLCVKTGLTLDVGDIYLILCAFSFTAHILVIDRVSKRIDCVKLSCIQFIVSAFLCGLVSLFTETFALHSILDCAVPLLYAGVLSGAAGYTLQMIAQRDVEPTVASLIMCLESVFAVLAGWLLIGERLSPRELVGCALMLAGIVLAQVRGAGTETGNEGNAGALPQTPAGVSPMHPDKG